MRPLKSSVSRLTTSFRGVANRFAFLFLMIAGVALLIAGKADVAIVERARTYVVDVAAPVLDIVSRPVAAFNRSVAEVERVLHIYTENERLRRENSRLRQWQQAAQQLERDNAHFRNLLNVKIGPGVSFVTARVIADTGGPFVRTLLLGGGSLDGIRDNQAVISSDGMVGHIVEVGKRSSRILLLTDLNSRVPVLIVNSGYRAILAGDNTALPRLDFLPVGAQVSPGDRIVTSGHGGIFPPGWPVGVVGSVADGVARVQPFTDWDRLEYVSVLRFNLPRLHEDARRP